MYNFTTHSAKKFPIDLKSNTNDISFTRNNDFAVVVSDYPDSIVILNLWSQRIRLRYLVPKREGIYDAELCHLVDHHNID